MFAVIFRATMKQTDSHYFETANRLRELALNNYDCIEFTSCTEGDQEIAISYWHSKEDIAAWHQNPEHQKAQKHGAETWYQSYSVQITEIQREYKN